MKSTAFRRINIVLNILVVVTAGTFTGLLSYRILHAPSLSEIEPKRLRSGSDFSGLPDVDIIGKVNTILFISDTSCKFTSEAVPLLKRLQSMSDDQEVIQPVAVFNNDEEKARDFLGENGLDVRYVANVDLSELGVDATPTIVIVDRNRKVVLSIEGVPNFILEKQLFELLKRKLSGG